MALPYQAADHRRGTCQATRIGFLSAHQNRRNLSADHFPKDRTCKRHGLDAPTRWPIAGRGCPFPRAEPASLLGHGSGK
ncbi:hypothetical protein AEM38_14260 [Hyphomonadaceae bacterium UKL13-1]|nr:hypothetical protein AEM38_14260 [Hyphomonadaceae bacterium UKL13-1]